MTTRMSIGNSSGNYRFRIAPPGYDATNLTHPAVFDSDNDYLKLHAVVDITLTRWSNSGQWYQGEAAFADLGYIPIVFVSITPTSIGRVFYPDDNNPATAEMNNFFDIAVSTNHIWVSTGAADGSSYDYRFRALIFKNPAES